MLLVTKYHMQLSLIDLLVSQPYYANQSRNKSQKGGSSMPRNTLNYTGLCLFIGLLFATPSWANNDPEVSDFVLFIEHSDTDWNYPAVKQETTTTRLLAVWHESFTESLKGGLRLAYLDISQAANPLPSGKNSTGYGLGIDVHAGLLTRPSLQLGLRLAYDYQSTSGKSSDQVSDFIWHSAEVALDMIVAPMSRLSFLSGVSLNWLDGEQRVSGNINQIFSFSEDEPFGYYAGLNLKTDATGGSIGFRYYGGFRQGGELVFRRHF